MRKCIWEVCLTGCPDMAIKINKEKSIGKVLYVVEGSKTEPYLLWRIFAKVFDYQVETILRNHPYQKFNSKVNPTSQIFVINTETSNIKTIAKDNDFLNNLFELLIEKYDFDIENTAIYYLFDRDCQSNTDKTFISNMLNILKNSRDNEGYERQGMLLLSYPSIESFTLSNFETNSFCQQFDLGDTLKSYLESKKINHNRINITTLTMAIQEMMDALAAIGVEDFDIDNFFNSNKAIFEYEEEVYSKESVYQALSLLCISLIDLGLIEVA